MWQQWQPCLFVDGSLRVQHGTKLSIHVIPTATTVGRYDDFHFIDVYQYFKIWRTARKITLLLQSSSHIGGSRMGLVTVIVLPFLPLGLMDVG